MGEKEVESEGEGNKKRKEKTVRRKPIQTKINYLYLSVGENSGDVEATWALNIHEETVRSLDQALKLVLVLLISRRWVKEISWHFNLHEKNDIQTVKKINSTVPRTKKQQKERGVLKILPIN